MSIDYLKNAVGPVPQTEAARPDQVKNNAGGYSFQVDDFTRLERFLILGTEGGSYYATERKLTVDNAQCVQRCIQKDGPRTIKTIVEVSEAGRAPKNDPAILALAIASVKGDDVTKAAAYAALPKVCRIGTHLYHFAAFRQAMGAGVGRAFRNAIGRWYNEKTISDLAYQMVKYQGRDGWSSRDLLNMAHVKPATADHDALYRWATYGYDACAVDGRVLPPLVEAFEEAKKPDIRQDRLIALIRDYNLPREAIPTVWLTKPEIWEALLQKMPMTALIRNLATMTRVGLLAPMSEATALVTTKLGNADALRKARVHPIQVLSALMTYRQGRGVRGDSVWTPVQPVIAALDDAFYKSFGSIEPTGKATLLGVDVSGSMDGGTIAGIPGLTPRMAAAAMAMVTANVEPRYHILGFSNRLVDIPVSKGMRLDHVMDVMRRIPMGGTDCALPMIWAKEQLKNKVQVEAFHVYTDSETWYGKVHPHTALEQYRRASGVQAKSIVVGFAATEFTIADPKDPGQLDVVGFDAAAPAVMADFVRGGSSKIESDEE